MSILKVKTILGLNQSALVSSLGWGEKNLLESENGLYQHNCITSKETLKLKSRIKLNHNTFKVITELLKSGTSVKKKGKQSNKLYATIILRPKT